MAVEAYLSGSVPVQNLFPAFYYGGKQLVSQ